MARSTNGDSLKQLNHNGLKWDDSGKNGYHKKPAEVRQSLGFPSPSQVTGVDAPHLCVFTAGVSPDVTSKLPPESDIILLLKLCPPKGDSLLCCIKLNPNLYTRILTFSMKFQHECISEGKWEFSSLKHFLFSFTVSKVFLLKLQASCLVQFSGDKADLVALIR